MAVQDFFTWGEGGAKLTPEQLAQRRLVLKALKDKEGDTSPVQHWTQGLARVADALGNNFEENRLGKAEAELGTYNQDLISNLLSGGKPVSSGAVPPSEATGQIAATSGQPVDMSGNDVYSGFMDTVKTGVQNPYALAAIAATGKAESGFDPGNATRIWSDPSESGEAGTAGGILSWRGPRYQALAATGDLSPQGQAKFFLQENPQLIEALNSAQSVEEAQSLMNNAWKFAGYNRPGGEAANRLAAAQGFLPSFQAGGEVAAGTPEAAIEAVSPVAGASLADEVAGFEQTPEYAAQFPGMEQKQAVAGSVPATGVQEVAQALPAAGQSQQQDPAINEAIYRAIADPRATPETKAVAQALMQQQLARQQAEQEMRMKQADPAYQIGLEKSRLEVENLRNPRMTPGDQLAREKFDFEKGSAGQTNDIKEYEYAKQQGYAGSFADFQQSMKKAGAASTNVNVGEGNKFYEALDKKNAETFSALSEEGMRGRGKLAQIDRLEQLMATAPQGGIGALKLAAGEYGIKTEGLSDIQAAQAIINELVPQQRQPGSGPMSDADLALFKQSLPRIINQPGGNQTILQTMRGITQYQIQMGEIADAVANREMSPDDARKAIRTLENPLDGYTKVVRQLENDEQDSGWRELTPGVRVRKVE